MHLPSFHTQHGLMKHEITCIQGLRIIIAAHTPQMLSNFHASHVSRHPAHAHADLTLTLVYNRLANSIFDNGRHAYIKAVMMSSFQGS